MNPETHEGLNLLRTIFEEVAPYFDVPKGDEVVQETAKLEDVGFDMKLHEAETNDTIMYSFTDSTGKKREDCIALEPSYLKHREALRAAIAKRNNDCGF